MPGFLNRFIIQMNIDKPEDIIFIVEVFQLSTCRWADTHS